VNEENNWSAFDQRSHRQGEIRNILGKLGAQDRMHAVVIGLKRGIVRL
jgi:hypothetical protein